MKPTSLKLGPIWLQSPLSHNTQSSSRAGETPLPSDLGGKREGERAAYRRLGGHIEYVRRARLSALSAQSGPAPAPALAPARQRYGAAGLCTHGLCHVLLPGLPPAPTKVEVVHALDEVGIGQALKVRPRLYGEVNS